MGLIVILMVAGAAYGAYRGVQQWGIPGSVIGLFVVAILGFVATFILHV